jgi:hypothetical protein
MLRHIAAEPATVETVNRLPNDRLGGAIASASTSNPQELTTQIRATPIGCDLCEAEGHSVRAYAPLLAMCRELVAAGYDPAGLNISDSLMTLFEEMAEHPDIGWNPSRLIIERFGLNADFIDANNLTWIDGLESASGSDLADPRHNDHDKPYVQNYLRRFGARKVEANALVVRPEQGRQLCRDAILRYIHDDGIDAYRRALATAREEARRAVAERIAP